MRKSPRNKWLFTAYLVCLILWVYYLIGSLMIYETSSTNQKFVSWLVLSLIGPGIIYGIAKEFDIP